MDTGQSVAEHPHQRLLTEIVASQPDDPEVKVMGDVEGNLVKGDPDLRFGASELLAPTGRKSLTCRPGNHPERRPANQ